MKLPVPFERQIEVKKISTDTIIDVYEETKNGNVYKAMLSMLSGSILIDDKKPSNSELKLFPLVNTEYLIVESFKKFGLPSKVEGVYRCPRIGCGHQIVLEKNRDEDTRIDVDKLEVNFSESDGTIEFEPKDHSFKGVLVEKMVFRPITIGDLISIQEEKKSTKHAMNEILYRCLVNMEYLSEDDLPMESIKNRYRLELFKFNDISDTMKLQKLFRSYGYNLFKEFSCPKCGKEWKQSIDFTGFFVYALSCIAEMNSEI
jgi:hypothetical protein